MCRSFAPKTTLQLFPVVADNAKTHPISRPSASHNLESRKRGFRRFRTTLCESISATTTDPCSILTNSNGQRQHFDPETQRIKSKCLEFDRWSSHQTSAKASEIYRNNAPKCPARSRDDALLVASSPEIEDDPSHCRE